VMKKRYVRAIGVEMEGGWMAPPERLYGDGSVRCSHPTTEFSGEISYHNEDPAELFKWMKRNYPSETNDTCGMHIHVSFVNTLLYMKLMERQFFDFFVQRMREWGKAMEGSGAMVGGDLQSFKARISDKNIYTSSLYEPDKQSRPNSKNNYRRSHLNYCYNLHGTIECRLMPMFSKFELSKDAVIVVAETMEEYLSKHRERPIVMNLSFDMSENTEVVQCA
jgi:hypothetical protein